VDCLIVRETRQLVQTRLPADRTPEGSANRGFSFMETDRFDIRSAEPDDFRALQLLNDQPKVIHGTMQVPFTSQETWRKRCAEWPENKRVIVACTPAMIVGCAAITIPAAIRRRHAGELGLVVHDAWHRRGVGSALLRSVLELADRWFNLTRVELTVYTDNLPAIALYEKHGFVREGMLGRYAFRDGDFVDAYTMARLRHLQA
jgi:L-phenylalanine/L-methionine N-acetyltransferase